MAAPKGDSGHALAEVRARTALRGAGLDPSVALERASSVTNEVWLTPTHVVRVNRRPDNRLYREALIGSALPPYVGHPKVIAHGGGKGNDWLIQERQPGIPLAHAWPTLSPGQRERAVYGLADRLSVLHATKAPPGLPPIEHAPQLLQVGAPEPTLPLLAALDKAADLPHVDPLLMVEVRDMVSRLAPALSPFDSDTLVHGDVTFENILWHDGDVTALLDLEWARPGPRDLDLDILLRCAAYPKLHVAEAYEAATNAADYADVPWWLGEAYPSLFEFPRQIDRVRLYSIAYDVRDLLSSPPTTPASQLSELHAYNRLQRVVQRRSYIDELGRSRV
jgi:aminoglycoside phosphotransferase